MTERKINSAIKKAQQCNKAGYYLEALLRMYHLNINILRFISSRSNVPDADSSAKPLQLIESLVAEINLRPDIKAIMAKKNLKSLRPWFSKMDLFFKVLKRKEPANTQTLLNESEQVLALLKIATTKLLINVS